MKILILSPRGIREMLGLNKPIYEKTAAYTVILEETQRKMGHFHGKKQINQGYLVSKYC